MKTTSGNSQYLTCESNMIYALLMLSAGMMGAYTFNLRGGVFCNAQTANFVMMAVMFGKGQIMQGFYYVIPITAYFFGTFLSEVLPDPIKRFGFLRWDTYFIAFEAVTLFVIGFLPLRLPDQIVQVAINFIASMQYNTFRQAEGVPMATTFCTNHLRQTGVACARAVRKKDHAALKRSFLHVGMLFCFVLGGLILTFFCGVLLEKSIWLALIPTVIILGRLVYADLWKERDLLGQKPGGH
ncbi:MAG: YoaK family protein [Roseburia sp.]